MSLILFFKACEPEKEVGLKPAEIACQFTESFLGYDSGSKQRDILLLGDESGSIGWINYEKIKKVFKVKY